LFEDQYSDPEAVRATVGSEVTVLDEKNIESVFVLTEGSAMPEIGYVSVYSPIGRALINKEVGDEVIFKAPSGERRLKIKAMSGPGHKLKYKKAQLA
jgi:transcription elongation GreA/GreB family factor